MYTSGKYSASTMFPWSCWKNSTQYLPQNVIVYPSNPRKVFFVLRLKQWFFAYTIETIINGIIPYRISPWGRVLQGFFDALYNIFFKATLPLQFLSYIKSILYGNRTLFRGRFTIFSKYSCIVVLSAVEVFVHRSIYALNQTTWLYHYRNTIHKRDLHSALSIKL